MNWCALRFTEIGRRAFPRAQRGRNTERTARVGAATNTHRTGADGVSRNRGPIAGRIRRAACGAPIGDSRPSLDECETRPIRHRSTTSRGNRAPPSRAHGTTGRRAQPVAHRRAQVDTPSSSKLASTSPLRRQSEIAYRPAQNRPRTIPVLAATCLQAPSNHLPPARLAPPASPPAEQTRTC